MLPPWSSRLSQGAAVLPGRPEAEVRAARSRSQGEAIGGGRDSTQNLGERAPTSGRQCGVSRAPARTPALAAAPSCHVTGGPPAHVWMTRRGLLWGCHRGRGDCNTRLPRGHTVRLLFAWPYTARLGTVASLNLDPGPTSDARADTCHPVPSRRWRFPSCHLSIARSVMCPVVLGRHSSAVNSKNVMIPTSQPREGQGPAQGHRAGARQSQACVTPGDKRVAAPLRAAQPGSRSWERPRVRRQWA